METSHLLISSSGGESSPSSSAGGAITGGLGIVTAAVFLVGEMAGTGLLAMPRAVMNTGA